MRTAYALLGIAWTLALGTIFFAAHVKFTEKVHTVKENSSLQNTMATSTLILTSRAFAPDASIPAKYTCDADQTSPPLSIAGAPEGTRSFVLILEDPDVPLQVKPDGKYLHWVLFNIPGGTTEITENESIGVGGANDSGKIGYVGPCPPREYEPSEHRYVFSLYALDTMLGVPSGTSRDEVMKAMGGHIIGETQLIARYKRI